MSRSSITIKSLRTLSSKVHGNSPTTYLCSKNLSLLKTLCIAAQKSDFYQHPNAINGETLVDNHQEFSTNTSVNFGGNLQTPDRNFRGNHSENAFKDTPVGKNVKFSGGYDVRSGRDGFWGNPVGGNGNLANGYTGESLNNGFLQTQVGENGGWSNGYTGESPRNEFQHYQAGKNVGFNGYYGENSGGLSQSPSSFNKENLNDHWKISSAGQHSGNGFYGQGALNADRSYGQTAMHSQQSSYNSYGGSSGNYQQVSSNYHGGFSGNYQHIGSNGYGGASGNYQQSSISYTQIQNEYQNAVGVGGQLDGDTAGIPKATIEELDELCKNGKLKEAVEVLGLLEEQHIPVDMPRYFMLMKACGEAKALEEAKSVHHHLIRSVSPIGVRCYNKILEMYCSCGAMNDAYSVFNKMPQRNLTSWDTMIIWLAKNDQAEEAIELFTRFKESGLKPDGQMFLTVFSVCSFLGDITEGLLHFESMSKHYGLIPSMEHYVGVVDMMGSTGYLDEALEFIEKMPVEPSINVWKSLTHFCRVHGNVELGDRCAELVELSDPASLDEQSKAGLIPVKASDVMKAKEKRPESSLMHVRSKVHEYRAGDTSHPDNDKLYALLRGLRQQMKEAGYVAETKFVLHDVDHESKEDALLAHSERLAVAQGLMSSPARSTMRILKNLRVCGDCHNALKIISKLVGREIVARDAKRFHHFRDGLCSCNDYW